MLLAFSFTQFQKHFHQTTQSLLTKLHEKEDWAACAVSELPLQASLAANWKDIWGKLKNVNTLCSRCYFTSYCSYFVLVWVRKFESNGGRNYSKVLLTSSLDLETAVQKQVGGAFVGESSLDNWISCIYNDEKWIANNKKKINYLPNSRNTSRCGKQFADLLKFSPNCKWVKEDGKRSAASLKFAPNTKWVIPG